MSKDEITIEEIDSVMNEETALTVANKESKLFLENSPFSPRQLLNILQKTPAKHVYRRPAKGGGEWDYVTGTYVKKVLNYVFGWMWNFEVKDKGIEGDCLWILGRLTVKDSNGNEIFKEQFGRADVKFKTMPDPKDSKKRIRTDKYLDYGNDLKAATTDALKKCAAEFGIASDIYGKNEFQEVSPETKKSILNAEDPATANQIDIISNLMKNRKITGAAVTMYLAKYKVTDLLEMTKGEAVKIMQDLTGGAK